MLTDINPKLPMRSKVATKDFYIHQLGFSLLGDYDNYILFKKDKIEIHFFEYKDLNLLENYGQVYIRTSDIDNLYQTLVKNKCTIHPNAQLDLKPWGRKRIFYT